MSEYGVFSGLDTAKQGPEKTSYSDIFQDVKFIYKNTSLHLR